MGQQPENFRTTCTNRLKTLTVEPYLLFCLLGYTVRLVSFQNLLMDRGCRNIHQFSDDICDHLENHPAEKTKSITTGNDLYMVEMLLASLPAMVVAVFLGPWSDKYTRKYPMIFAASGMFLESLGGAVLMAFPHQSPWLLVSMALFSGVSGGFIISYSSAFSYLSDVTDERSRPARFAVLEFATIAAIVIGNITGGQLFDAASPNYVPVMVISPFSFGMAVLYTVFFVKETKPPVDPERKGEMFRDLFSLDNIKQSYVACSKKRPGNIRLQIWLLVWISCSQKFTDMGTLAVSFPYAKSMYGWNVTQFSNASVAFYIVNALVVLIVIPMLSNTVKLHEAALGLVGMLSLIAKMVLTSVAIRPELFYYAWICGALANSAGIAVRSRLSKLVSKEELGRTFSLLGAFESITPVIGSTVFLQFYNASTDIFLGMPFAAAAVFLLPCAIIFIWMMGLPTISLAEYTRRDEEDNSKPLENLSTNYSRLEDC